MPDRFSSTDLVNRATSTLNWDDLRVVTAIHQAGSLRGAARSMGVNHATVNRRLTHLEAALGARLFDRRPEGYVLSQAGEDVLAVAEKTAAELLAVERRIGGRDDAPYGTVRLNIPPALLTSFLPEVLADFARAHPEIELDVDASHSFTDLARREADVTLRMDAVISDDVVARKVIDYAKAVYAAPELAEEIGRNGIDPARHFWIGWGKDMPHRGFPAGTPFPDIPCRHALFSNTLQMQTAKVGLGLTLLPCFLGDPDLGLARVPGTELQPGKSLWLLFHGDLRRTARIRALVDFLVPAIKSHRRLIEGAA
ncbi:LysR family transcriptional regulator [Hwanghaeella grinnelliae]|uniref:LysR family transcriptional regulator n=1 Tax=Hwanghaeella grinnelliae TaxID=2500179 RepID=A0A437QJY0_9PROT|nr:LysR family transcriptional regulator [Hwanghaeella grinnelliae]RVU34827.1 LysR family transcriptional regulator [Hwanghaeella grinnelliae]